MTVMAIKDKIRKSFDREMGEALEDMPGSRYLIVVRDPRSFIANRLRKAYSKEERRDSFFKQIIYWFRLHNQMVNACDKRFPRCQIVRYEDLVLRPEKDSGN